MPKTHLVVALVNDGAGFHLALDAEDADTPEAAAARFLARQDVLRVAVYEYAVLDRAGTIAINPIRPAVSLDSWRVTTRPQ